MREAGIIFDAAKKALTLPIHMSLVQVPGYEDANGLPIYYLGFVDSPEDEAAKHVMQVGAKGKICWEEQLTTVEPQGWKCEIKPLIPGIEYYGALTILLTRAHWGWANTAVVVAPRPSLDMLDQSDYKGYFFPESDDIAAKRLVDCSSKLLNDLNSAMEEVRRLRRERELRV